MLTVDLEKIKVARGGRILDIGCGNGRHTAAAAGMPVATVVGMDTNLEDLRKAVKRLELHRNLGVTAAGGWGVISANALQIPFGKAVFDVVICSEVLAHIHDHQRAIGEAVRVLRPGGWLLVSVPRFWPEKICWRLSREYTAADGGHIRIYKTSALVDMLKSYGLHVCGMHYAHSLHAPYWWLKCLVGPSQEEMVAVRLYDRFLTWDMMRRPRTVRFLERLLNPLLGKSVVIYLKKKR